MRKTLIILIPLIILMLIGMLSGNLYSLGHYKDLGGPGGSVEDCNICHDFVNGYYNSPTQGNLRWVKPLINGRQVEFTRFSGAPGTLADGIDTDLDGPCEVCHTATSYHTNTPDGKNHFDGMNCTGCHPHFLDDIVNYFEPRFKGTQSHITHFEDPKGPMLGTNSCTYNLGGCHNPGDYQKFGPDPGQPLATTTVCNSCHSQGGAFDGVGDAVIGAKANWTDGVYEPEDPPDLPPWPFRLKAGKEDWCAGCHDNGTSVVRSVSAPNVMGDNVAYGYNVSGHGRNPLNFISCADCHDFTMLHTDANARTYSASLNNYKAGYRLTTGMAIPRYGDTGINAFRLCFNCHTYADVFNDYVGAYIPITTNFRDDLEKEAYHKMHLGDPFAYLKCWDSDWNSSAVPNNCQNGVDCVDSAMSCPACHNVHGSPMVIGSVYYPNPPMLRHGELISTPGTQNKVPALDFQWYTVSGSQTQILADSRSGGLICGAAQDVSVNHICWGCHQPGPSGYIKYYRTPGGPEGVVVENVWTTDLDNVPKEIFRRGEDIRYHVKFKITGPSASYYVTAKGPVKDSAGTILYRLSKVDTIAAGTYEWPETVEWDKKIPTSAATGAGAKVTITVRMFNALGGTLIASGNKSKTFTINP